MTTTIYDKENGLITCDSRWSIPDNRFGVLYVDEAEFSKVEIVNGHVFVFAGKANIISAWKYFLRAQAAGIVLPEPTMAGIAALVAELGTGTLKYYYGQDIVLPDQSNPMTVIAGTGSSHAARCWEANKCPKKAVSSAMMYDVCTGGEVRYVELQSGANNLNSCVGFKSLQRAFLEKGMVMFNGNQIEKGPVPFKEAADIDPTVADWHQKIANGSVLENVQAPCDAMFSKPSDEERARMSAVLKDVFG
ncbi:hypothetical protein NDO41_16225 [Ectopseudomonas mendocina]|nr:hypothetical protein NDO41_16225 [Pseudomonas mendocina]